MGGLSHNIAEGSKASGTSKETEIKLTNVARASLEELLIDYEDFLRVRDAVVWDKESKEAQFVCRLGAKPGLSYEDIREFVETRPGEVVANIALCFVHQTNYLLDQQIKGLERDFLKEGGLRERMSRARIESRKRMGRGQAEAGGLGQGGKNRSYRTYGAYRTYVLPCVRRRLSSADGHRHREGGRGASSGSADWLPPASMGGGGSVVAKKGD